MTAPQNQSDSNSVGFHVLYEFHHAMLDPIYALLKDEFACFMSNDINSIIAFQPRVLLVAGSHYFYFRRQLPRAIIIWTRHGFSSKNYLKHQLRSCDFACVSSEWVRGELVRKGWLPRLDYWVTGFVPMDRVFQRTKDAVSLNVSTSERSHGPTLLYAPTWNRYISSVELFGEERLHLLQQAFPELTIIIKPHPHHRREYSTILHAWQRLARQHDRIQLIDESNANIYDYLPVADILLTDASSVMFYFLALDRPMILVNNPQRFRNWEFFDPEGPEWTWRDMGIEIETTDELIAAVGRSLTSPNEKSERRAFYRDRVFGDLRDGRAAERIAQKVKTLLSPRAEEREWTESVWKRHASSAPSHAEGAAGWKFRYFLTHVADSLYRYPRFRYALKKFLKWNN